MRVTVRTTTNLSYVGELVDGTNFQTEGMVLRVNPNIMMEVFIPKEEVQQIIVNGEIFVYTDFLSSYRR